MRRIDVETAAELAEATRAEFPSSHVLLMAAAPADFRPPAVEPGKLKRDEGLELRLEPTEDILAGLAAHRARRGQTIVGFAAEAGEGGVERAREKLERKGADLIVLNDVSDPAIGFESEENAVTLIDAEARADVPSASKDEIAEAILDRVDRCGEPGGKERAILSVSFFVPSSLEKWAWPTFFSPQITWKTSRTTSSSSFTSSIGARPASPSSDPATEALRLFVDHPDGVDLALCERVTKHLNHLLADYSLEVSSPGPKYRRPSPDHRYFAEQREGEPEEVQ